ncbi:MAG TPA: hypothetical protein VNA28_02125 [Solirubrobacteraceae bacterium]|nr:hypothetical protein [Solirubrobacteraceae bacterium]
MEFYEDPNYCAPPEPAPVEICEPAPLPFVEPPAYEPPAAEIFPDVPAAPVVDLPAAPAAPIVEAPMPAAAPETVLPVADAPLSSGTLLGPSTVGGSTETGSWIGGAPDLSASGYVGGSPDLSASGYVGGSPDLGASTTLGGTTPDLGGIRVEYNGMPVAPFDIPVTPGPFNAVAQNILNAHNAAIVDSALGGSGSTGTPAPWMPGFDSDHDGVLNERDANPRDRFEA